MAIPKIKKDDIIEALKYIDENGVPVHNESTEYELVFNDDKKYPIKYVLAVANHLANGVEISTENFNTTEAKHYLERLSFIIKPKRQKIFELMITADNVTSTDERFTMDDLNLGDNYEPIEVYFRKADGEIIRRSRIKGERQISNRTMPHLACQIFEKQLAALSVEEKELFPICQYTPNGNMICGIYSSVDEFKKHMNSIEHLNYGDESGTKFVIYCWNIFSTIIFVQECLKRFGDAGDEFILKYCEKEREKNVTDPNEQKEYNQQFKDYIDNFSSMLIESKNLILRGAPGTGKSYLAKEIATNIVSNGAFYDYTRLSDEQKEQVEFVQFHPSYDYSDFVEGLRPLINDNGNMVFELQDGIFKKFVDRARENFEDCQKPDKVFKKEFYVQEAMSEFISTIELGVDVFKTTKGNKFIITDVNDKYISIFIPSNSSANTIKLNLDEIRRMLESENKFTKPSDITSFVGIQYTQQRFSYDLAIYNEIEKRIKKISKMNIESAKLKKYVFIIDEINRGEISKIFGELFFAIDPGYRGRAGEILTQYANLHTKPDQKFYIPDNVYIIGTMNDIDRSVDSFDFAMRRRFRFVKLGVNEQLNILDSLENEELKLEAIKRMKALNNEIGAVEDLNENYQIGAAYFLKLKTLNFDQLWTDYLQPLLQEYVQGMYDEEGIMNRFAKAYGYTDGDIDETSQD